MKFLLRRLTYIAAAIALTLAMGTTGFAVIEHYPVFDAFYMTVITVSTVGYHEIHPLSHGGRIFNSFLIFFGVTVMFFAIGAMTQSIIELELGEYLGKRRTRRMIEKLEKHFIICGYGRVGRNASQELKRAGVPFVIADRNPERVEKAMLAGLLAVEADATRDETLHAVGITRARGLVSALATDADNLFVILSAKNLNPQLYVATRAGRCGGRALHRRRVPPRAGGLAVARFPVLRFRDQEHGAGRRYRAGPRPRVERVRRAFARADAPPPRAGRHRARHPQSRWAHALQPAGRNRDLRRRSPHRDGRAGQFADAGKYDV